ERGPGGLGSVAGRYATLLTWIYSSVHTTGAFCATGNSGGSAEVSYALARYGRDAILDAGLPSGGPPMSRLDDGCGAGDTSWPTDCATIMATQQMCSAQAVASECFLPSGPGSFIDMAYAPETPCANAKSSHAPALGQMLLADSVLARDAELDYPKTKVDFLFGR